MNCPVGGCPVNDHGSTYMGTAVCMQAFCGDPEDFRQTVRGCLLNGSSKSLEARISRLEDAVHELNPGLFIP